MKIMSTIRVFKLRSNAELPQKAHSCDAGFDLFYCPAPVENSNNWDNSETITVYPGERATIPTGIKIEFSTNLMVEIKNRSSVAIKRNLIVGACVIDSGYDGEVFIDLHNVGKEKQIIQPGEKIAQMVPVKVDDWAEIKESFIDNLNVQTERGEGWCGSTDGKNE